MLPLWSSLPCEHCRFAAPAEGSASDWPVKPRRGPLAGLPEMKLNLPNFPKRYCNQLVDWGSCGMLAVSLQQSVYIWKEGGGGGGGGGNSLRSYYSELLTEMGPEQENWALSVCWSPRYEPVLMIGTTDGTIQVSPFKNK